VEASIVVDQVSARRREAGMAIRTIREQDLQPQSRLTSEQVWQAVARASFAVLSHVTPGGSPQARSVLDELGSLIPVERRVSACVIEIMPVGAFRTYGLGVSLRTMLDPAAAQARVPVAPDEGIR
jgi:hypothetical protein